MTDKASPIEAYSHTGNGYLPLVISSDWQVAVLNWEPGGEEISHLKSVERHVQTDEVFVLTRGRAALICLSASDYVVIDMQPGVIYNVKSATWHNLLTSQDASMIIVEKRDTHLNDDEMMALDQHDLLRIKTMLPGWLVRPGN